MLTPNVVLLPGLFGSALGYPPPGSATKANLTPLAQIVWLNPLDVFAGNLSNLQLAADGLTPGPASDGQPVYPLGVLASTYQPLIDFMVLQGWNVYPLGYDWRKSILVSGPAVWTAIQAYFGTEPFVIVAHSMGGLVARSCYKAMLAAGAEAQLKGLITLGTPHFGSWAPVRGFFALDAYYNLLMSAISWFQETRYGYHNAQLDSLIGSWPGWYELLPFRNHGPLATNDPATAALLYTAGFYVTAPGIQQHWLDSAAATQDAIQGVVPPFPLTTCVAGENFETPYELAPGYPPYLPIGYLSDGRGDVIVPSDYAAPTGVSPTLVTVSHGDFPFNRSIYDLLIPLVWRA